jgi:hypothetical protein
MNITLMSVFFQFYSSIILQKLGREKIKERDFLQICMKRHVYNKCEKNNI